MSVPASSLPIRVLVADDHDIVRRGLRSLLNRQRDIVIVGEAATAGEMRELARKFAPNVIVTDLRMPGESTIAAIRDVCLSVSSPRVVVFTGFDSQEDVLLSFRAGALAYVVKGSGPADILTAIRSVHAGQRYLDPQLDELLVERLEELIKKEAAHAEQLSAREAQVLEMTALGYTNKEMAQRLGIGVRSVETYRYRATEKLGLKSRAEVTHYVHHSGILKIDRGRRTKP